MNRRYRSVLSRITAALLAAGAAHAEPLQEPSGINLAKKLFTSQANPSLTVVFHDKAKKGTRILRCARPPCEEVHVAESIQQLPSSPEGSVASQAHMQGKSLYMVRFVPSEPSPKADAEVSSPPGAAPRPASGQQCSNSDTLEEFAACRDRAHLSQARMVKGQSAGGTLPYLNDLAQAAGQVVVDRASAATMDKVSAKLREWLGCDPSERGGEVKWPQTCITLKTVRVQDLAGASAALRLAILRDMVATLMGRALAAARTPRPEAAASPSEAEDLLALQSDMLERTILPDVIRVSDGASSAAPELVTARIMGSLKALVVPPLSSYKDQYARSALIGAITSTPSLGQAAVILGGAAMALCAEQNPDDLAACNVPDAVEWSADKWEAQTQGIFTTHRDIVVARAQELALHLLNALVLTKGSEPDHRQRFVNGVDGALDSACLLLDGDAETLPGCPARLKLSPKTTQDYLGDLRFLLVTAVEKDFNGFIVTAANSVDVDQKSAKAIKLVAAILKYSATYANRTTTQDQTQADRVKTLDGLSSELTDRTMREEDWVFSFGGALRAVGGVKLGFDKNQRAFHGPLSLPLGVAVQKVDSAFVFNDLELGIVDLGNYLTYEQGGKVKTPDVADALAPTLSIGHAWGKSVPIILALTSSYTPHYKFTSEDTGAKGAITVGLAVGAYVPIFDVN